MTFLVVLFAIAGAVWTIPLIQQRRLFWLALLILGLGTVVGPSFFYLDGPIQLSLDRILWFGMVGMGFFGLRLGMTSIPKLRRVDWLLAAIVGWFLVSAIRGGEMPGGNSPLAPWLFYIVIPAGMYAIARLLRIELSDVSAMLTGAIGLGVYLAVTGVCEWQGLHAFVFPRFIVDGETYSEFFGRARGPLLNPIGNGIVMSVALAACVCRFLPAGKNGRILYGLIGVVLLTGIYATLTRSVWIGAILVLSLYGFLYLPRWVRVLGLVTGVFLAGAVTLGMHEQLANIKRDKDLSAADAAKSVELRPLLAIVAWEMFKDNPIAGHGYGRYLNTSKPYHADRSYDMPLEEVRGYVQHNVFLSILVDTGLIGFAMILAWIAMIAFTGWTLARSYPESRHMQAVGTLMLAMLLVYMMNGMFHDVMVIIMVHSFLFFIAGVSVTAAQQKELAGEKSSPSPNRSFGRIPAAA